MVLVGLQKHALKFAGLFVLENIFFLGHVFGQLDWTPRGEEFLLLFITWFIPIHTRMGHPLGVGHSGDR